MSGTRHSRHTRTRVIENFRKFGRVDLATKAAGVDRSRHYEWLKQHADYKAAFESAREEVVDMLEDEAFRRAYEGTIEPVFHAGKRALDFAVDEKGEMKLGKDGKPIAAPAFIRRYSDSIITFLLKGRRREVYGDKQEITGKDGEPLNPPVTLADVRKMIADDAAE